MVLWWWMAVWKHNGVNKKNLTALVVVSVKKFLTKSITTSKHPQSKVK